MARYVPDYKIYDYDTATLTRYLIVTATETRIVSVDEMIDDHEQSTDTVGVYMILASGHVLSVEVEDQDPDWDQFQRKQRGWHFTIREWRDGREGPLLEEVRYRDNDREEYEQRVVCVDGFPTPIE